MSARQTIDSMRFARSGDQLQGVFTREDLPRLAEVLPPGSENVSFRLQGKLEAGRPALELELQVLVSLVCQRCMVSYLQPLQICRVFPLAKDEAQLTRWEVDDPLLEALLSSPKFLIAELVEDEIMLSLPTVPRHPEGECESEVQSYLQ